MPMNKKSELIKGSKLQYVYDLLKANVLRNRRTMILLLMRMDELSVELTEVLQKMARDKDVLFLTDHPEEIGLLLPNSKLEEARGFFKRFSRESGIQFGTKTGQRRMKAAVMEVVHPDLSIETALSNCRQALDEASERDSGLVLEEVHSTYVRPIVSVKVSILDDDSLFTDLLRLAIERLDVPGTELEVRTFGDGLSFMELDWVSSWHPHLVVMSDALPKKNGLDILHELRSMPNEGKFIILMMTRRNSEEDMIYAYESGTDGYLVKPFNLRLFEAQVQRLLKGLWA